MPIRINLLADALADEDLRRRDPVKRTIYAGAFLVALSFVWFSSIWLEYMVDKQKLNQADAAIHDLTPNYTIVKDDLKKISDIQGRLDALDHLTAARFLQGNLMNVLQQTYVPNVQLTHLRVDQSYILTPAVAAKAPAPARPASITERIVLNMDAKDFSANPGDQVNHYKDALLKQDFFKTSIDPVSGIRLSGLSALQTPIDSKPYVMFTLECKFLDKTP
jgi:hypothetical protein